MQLLVSVGNATEALAALQGGADLIDAKDAHSGALGAVSPETLSQIHAAIAPRRPVTAALGDASDETAIEDKARRFANAGAAFVKVGFAGISSTSRVRDLIRAATRGARAGQHHTALVAVAYADADQVGSLAPPSVAEIAADAGADGLLIDTANKSGPGLVGLVEPRTLAAWVEGSHRDGLFVALAGKLTSDDLGLVCDTGADIAGVRGAACDGGRIGHVVADRVRLLQEQVATGVQSPSSYSLSKFIMTAAITGP